MNPPRTFIVMIVRYCAGIPTRPHLVSATFRTQPAAKRFAVKLAIETHAVVEVQRPTGMVVARMDPRAPGFERKLAKAEVG